MKKNTDPHQMTLGQFLLFLIVGGIAVIWLCLEINIRLHPSIDPAATTPAPLFSHPIEESAP